jgi:hypothetical protein
MIVVRIRVRVSGAWTSLRRERLQRAYAIAVRNRTVADSEDTRSGSRVPPRPRPAGSGSIDPVAVTVPVSMRGDAEPGRFGSGDGRPLSCGRCHTRSVGRIEYMPPGSVSRPETARRMAVPKAGPSRRARHRAIVALERHRTPDRTTSCDRVCRRFQSLLYRRSIRDSGRRRPTHE